MSRPSLFTCVLALFVYAGLASPSAAQTLYLEDGGSAFVMSGAYGSTPDLSSYSATVGFAGSSRYAFGLVYSSSTPQSDFRGALGVRSLGLYSELRLTSSDSPARFTTDFSVQRILGEGDLTGALVGGGLTMGRAFMTSGDILIQPNISMGLTYQSIGQ